MNGSFLFELPKKVVVVCVCAVDCEIACWTKGNGKFWGNQTTTFIHSTTATTFSKRETTGKEG